MVRLFAVRPFWLILACVGGLLLLNGCNTMRGVGKDIERAGEVIQGKSAARGSHPAMPVAAP